MHHIDLKAITIRYGSHVEPGKVTPKAQACIMEWIAVFAGEPWGDQPTCTSPIIGAFLRHWNDALPDDASRTRLLAPLIPVVVGTVDEHDDKRAWMATDWLVRTFAPTWLRLAGLTEHADALEGLDALTTDELADRALPIIKAAASAAASAAWSAAWSAAASAAWSAAASAPQPTVVALQDSAVDLVRRMAAVEAVVA